MAAAGTNEYFFLEMRSRYLLDCRLTQAASLHVGTGVSGADTDAPFIRQGLTPFVPGSSLRGVMRSTVERVTRSLGAGPRCCILFEDASDECWAGNDRLRTKFETAKARERTGFLRSDEFYLCPVCRLFGSTLMAAQLKVSDARFEAAPKLVRRDGVGIDRDTETARPKIKYDFEVAEPGGEDALEFTLQLENSGSDEMALVYILLKEMERGFAVGGKKSCGLGTLTLRLNKVSYFDSGLTGERQYTLQQYLSAGYGDFPLTAFQSRLQDCFAEFVKPKPKE